MNKIYELSWLWKSLGIALAAAAVAVALAALICRAVILLSNDPMPI